MNATIDLSPDALRARLVALNAETPRPPRARTAAKRLGVSEAQLMALGCGGAATRLREVSPELLSQLEALGPVMALTRNDHVVIETDGSYQNPRADSHMGIVEGDRIDLRLFLHRWSMAFAFVDSGRKKVRRSVQFFDASGRALHKVFLREDSDVAAFERLVAEHRSEDQSCEQEVAPIPDPVVERPDEEIDREAFGEAWNGMKNTHDFYSVMRRAGVSRVQALRLAPEGRVEALSPVKVFSRALRLAADAETPIMIFVGNPGCLQIHTGPVKRLVETPPWFNVLDPNLDLHVQEAGIARAFVVRKPTDDGVVTSLEMYDSAGESVAWMFGVRKPGQVERADWRALLGALMEQP